MTQRANMKNLDQRVLDGCVVVRNTTLGYCSARTGYTRLNRFTTSNKDGKWTN